MIKPTRTNLRQRGGTRIGELLLDAKAISISTLKRALAFQAENRELLGQCLMENGSVPSFLVLSAIELQILIRSKQISRKAAVKILKLLPKQTEHTDPSYMLITSKGRYMPLAPKVMSGSINIPFVLVLSCLVPSAVTICTWLLLACIDGTCFFTTALSNVLEDPKIFVMCFLAGEIGLTAAVLILVLTFLWRLISRMVKKNLLREVGRWLPMTSWAACMTASLLQLQSILWI